MTLQFFNDNQALKMPLNVIAKQLHWSGMVAPDRVLSMGQIDMFDYLNRVQTNDWFLSEFLDT